MKEEERSLRIHTLWLYWYVKKVTFLANSTTKTATRFTTRYDEDYPTRYGTYIFGSGKSWKGNIQKSVFKIIKAEEDSSTLYIGLPKRYYTNNVVQRTMLQNGELLEFHNYKPDAKDDIRFNLETKEELETKKELETNDEQ